MYLSLSLSEKKATKAARTKEQSRGGVAYKDEVKFVASKKKPPVHVEQIGWMDGD
jgi:hypothetical protein